MSHGIFASQPGIWGSWIGPEGTVVLSTGLVVSTAGGCVLGVVVGWEELCSDPVGISRESSRPSDESSVVD